MKISDIEISESGQVNQKGLVALLTAVIRKSMLNGKELTSEQKATALIMASSQKLIPFLVDKSLDEEEEVKIAYALYSAFIIAVHTLQESLDQILQAPNELKAAEILEKLTRMGDHSEMFEEE